MAKTKAIVKRKNQKRSHVGPTLTIGGGMSTQDAMLFGLKSSCANASGEVVTPETTLGLSAVYACIRNISEDLAKFPLKVYQDQGDGKRKYRPEMWANEILLRIPNSEMTPMTFWETLCHWALGWRYGVAEIERNGKLEPIALWPIHPSRVCPFREPDGRLTWKVTTYGGRGVTLEDRDVFNLHGLGCDGVTGYSPAMIAPEAFGRAMAVQTFGGAFFGNGATFGQVFEYTAPLSPEARKNLKKSLEEQHAGAKNAYKTYVIEGGKLSSGHLGIDPEAAQVLDTARFGIEDLARFFRCPTSKIQHWLQAKGWSTLDAEEKDYVTGTLTPWLKRIQQEANRKLLPARGGFYTKHVIDFLLYATPQDRANYMSSLFKIGMLSINEGRELDDKEPIGPGGDEYWVEGNNMVTVKAAIKMSEEPPKPAEPTPNGNKQPASEDDTSTSDAGVNRATIAESFTGVLADAYQRMLRVEADRIKSKPAKAEFLKWSEGFYAEHVDTVRSAITPIVRGLAQAMTATGGSLDTVALEAEISAMATRHIEVSRRELHTTSAAASDVTEKWLTGRAERAAAEDVKTIVGKIPEK